LAISIAGEDYGPAYEDLSSYTASRNAKWKVEIKRFETRLGKKLAKPHLNKQAPCDGAWL
jgi:hypothetical protein